MAQSQGLEVFQDLVLRGPDGSLAGLRRFLIECAKRPWSHAKTRERELSQFTGDDADIVAFERAPGDGINRVALILWSKGPAYEVTNIVPSDVSDLGVHGYNAALIDFADRVARPAAKKAGFDIFISEPLQGPEDWLHPQAATALRRFSAAANKSTGSSHPMDRQRWHAFLIAAHEDASELDSETLARWLVEAEGWSEDKAHNLAVQYERGLGLLADYDRHQA